MARRIRVEYEGAVYHIMNRGDRRESMSLEEGDRELFLEAAGQTCSRTGWQAHSKDNAAGRRQLEQSMEHRKELEWAKQSDDWKRLRRGWCFGSKEFRKELLERVGKSAGPDSHGKERRESDEQRAKRIVAEMLKSAEWSESELAKRGNADPRKVKIATQLREETTMRLLQNYRWVIGGRHRTRCEHQLADEQ